MNDDEIDPSVQANTTAVTIQRALRFLIIATIVLYVGVSLVVGWVYVTARNNTDALCALRSDVESRIVTSQQYLVDHPDGTEALPKATLQTSIANSKRTVNALKGISCPND